ncbi:DUF3021 family protein [Fructilactobacillus vespulae]|uniref:DUF3021 family protein n=1 Tax=Fructilactobacillus vespulae TaxID=1249630 RepID=UPI0039B61DBB
MKNKFEFLKSGIMGMMIGSICYLIVQLTYDVNIITKFGIISVWLGSFLVGIISMLIGNEILPTCLTYILHLSLTAGIILLVAYFNDWEINYIFGLEFLGIYLLVWVGLLFWNWLSAKRINAVLKNKNS